MDQCSIEAEFRSPKPCDDDICDACMLIMKTEGLVLPVNHTNAINLYIQLKRKLC